MNSIFDVVIIGGGLAGLTAAIHLSRSGRKILLIEKNSYPKHKVCGEYISNEVLPYLNFLGINLQDLKPVPISKSILSTVSGEQIESNLPVGGLGISRFLLDDFLFQKALSNGCQVKKATVNDVTFKGNMFDIVTEYQVYKSEFVLGAFGKRSNIDQKMQRDFISKKSPWLAVKAHYLGEFPNDVVALHNFRGGYCGVSKVEDGAVNVCYLADYETFKKYRNVDDYQKKVVSQNPHLKAVFEKFTRRFDKPITISQISFASKPAVENHILMVGDTAGLIHPLCGNGMAMAIHSAKIACELLLDFFDGRIKSREKLEKKYTTAWKHHFSGRVRTGKLLASLMRHHTLVKLAMRLLIRFPSWLPKIIAKTHGKPITAEA